MIRISSLEGLKVLQPKKAKTAKDGSVVERFSKVGKVHMAVFSPDGLQVVGLMVRRPDVAGVVKRDDVFLAWDSFYADEEHGGLVVDEPSKGMDLAAVRRLGLDWDHCIMWEGIDATTRDGKPLGFISDAEVDPKGGRVVRFFTTDGVVAHALVGSFSIAADQVDGYCKGRLVVNVPESELQLDGGMAAAAGEGFAKAKAGVHEAGKVAGSAVQKGSYALGKAIGKAQRAFHEATAEDEEPQPQAPAVPAGDPRVEVPPAPLPERAGAGEPTAKPKPKTYRPAEGGPSATKAGKGGSASGGKSGSGTSGSGTSGSGKSSTSGKKQLTGGEKAARAVGRQISSMGKMFSSFKEEFDKASK